MKKLLLATAFLMVALLPNALSAEETLKLIVLPIQYQDTNLYISNHIFKSSYSRLVNRLAERPNYEIVHLTPAQEAQYIAAIHTPRPVLSYPGTGVNVPARLLRFMSVKITRADLKGKVARYGNLLEVNGADLTLSLLATVYRPGNGTAMSTLKADGRSRVDWSLYDASQARLVDASGADLLTAADRAATQAVDNLDLMFY